MAITNYKKQEETANRTGRIGSATPYNGMNGVSQNTANNLGNYQQGYQPSERVTQAQQNLQAIQAQKPQGYNSKYQGQLESIMQQIQNPQGFKYEFNGDNLFKAYQDMYTQLGKQASMDAMGQAAGLTGGYGSSYGQQVGQQAYQQNLLRLYDRGMDLHDRAYQAYRDKQGDLKDQYAMAQAADESGYNRYRDTVGDWQREEQQAADRAMQAEEMDYNTYRDALNYYTQLAQIENGAYNTEAERQEAIRQFNEKFAEERRQYDTSLGENQRQFNEQLAENQRQANMDEQYRRDTLGWQQQTDARDYEEKVRQYNENLAEEQRQADLNEGYRRDTLAEEIRQNNLNEQYRRDTLAEEQRQAMSNENYRDRTLGWQQETDARDYEEKVRQYNENLAEEQRQARANEDYRDRTLAEEQRQAMSNEDYRDRTLAEEQRQAMANEGYRDRALDEQIRGTNLDEQYRRDTLGWQQQTDARDFDESVRQANMRTAMSYVSAIIENGQMPSDELLAMAGLSRQDAMRMIRQAEAGGTPAPAPAPAPNDNDGRTPDRMPENPDVWEGYIWAGINSPSAQNTSTSEGVKAEMDRYLETGTGRATKIGSRIEDLKKKRAAANTIN